MKCLKFSPFLLAFSALTTCVKEYPLSISGSGNSILVVDAVLCHSNKPDINDYKIQIYKSESIKGQTPNQIPIQQANAEIVVNDSAVYPLIEREAGTYELLQRPIFKTGYRYKLRFNAVGNSYESSAETLPDSVPILKIYAQLREKPNANRAFNVYVDIQDNPTVRNYYRWSAIQWERLEYCQYCYEAPMRSPVCRPDLFGSLGGEKLVRNNRCQSDCYEILRSNPNNSLSDFFFDGNLVQKQPVAEIPYNFPHGTLIEVRQSSLTPQYFDFTELLKSQTTATGGLVDVPPAFLSGNIRNKNDPAEKVIGYFSVVNTVWRRLWLDRFSAGQVPLPVLSTVNEPKIPSFPIPPEWLPIPCIESATRTGIKPFGWID